MKSFGEMVTLRRILCAASFCSVLSLNASGATIRYVDDDAPLGGDGLSWPTAYRYLQDALIEAAEPGSGVDEIRIGQGTYTPDLDEGGVFTPGDRDASFEIVEGLVVAGGYAGFGAPDPDARDVELYETILSGDLNGDDGPDFTNYGDNSYTVVDWLLGTNLIELDGLSIRSAADGGGVAGPGGPAGNVTRLWIHHCTFEANLGDTGGGAELWSSTLIEHSSFVNNRAAQGGGAYIAGEGVMLHNVMFSKNVATSLGGAIEIATGYYNMTSIDACLFTENTSDRGGAIGTEFAAGNALITNSEFEANSATAYGGCISNSGNVFVIADCVFRENHSVGRGGVLWFDEGSSSFVRCAFYKNSSDDNGGVIAAEENVGEFTSCVFFGNEAKNGGAIYFDTDGYLSAHTAMNCLFVGNHAIERGGAVYCVGDYPGAPVVSGCTFTENDADEMGGAVHIGGGLPVVSELSNSVLWNNSAPSGHEISMASGTDQPVAAEVAYCLVDGGLDDVYVDPGNLLTWGDGNIDGDPLFVALPDPGGDGEWGTMDDDAGDLRIGAESPCIDAADNTRVLPDVGDLDDDGDFAEPAPFDLAGAARFVDDPDTVDTGFGDPPIVDMGAYEFQAEDACPGDTNDDDVVNVDDLFTVLGDWGETDSPGDVNDDGVVDICDLFIVLDHWGPC
jgi:predicted outer membrane repeat protein